MSDARATAYLRRVLALDPATAAAAIIMERRHYLHPADVVTADIADGEEDPFDLRARMLARLEALRRDFWELNDATLENRLRAMELAGHAETAAAAARLRQVALERESFRRLQSEPGVHPTFLRALAQIVIAPAAEANRLREREHGWMRPEQNPQYAAACRAVQSTAWHIRQHFPHLFALEEAWLSELLEYNPQEETEHQSANTFFGIATLGALALTIFVLISVLRWVFA